VADLEKAGWVTRASDESDNRVRLVRLTDKGAQLIARVQDDATAELRAVWDDFTHDEWHRFIDFLNRFEHGVRRVRASAKSANTTTRRAKA
jgi:DNA-binding MarR family transcriptional regulator